ncbi:hypothetical protein QJS66_21500 [Kocuria rhizophila]|nr:hypothetical protein QJS66_21500 [Kocuria rhizophila]
MPPRPAPLRHRRALTAVPTARKPARLPVDRPGSRRAPPGPALAHSRAGRPPRRWPAPPPINTARAFRQARSSARTSSSWTSSSPPTACRPRSTTTPPPGPPTLPGLPRL